MTKEPLANILKAIQEPKQEAWTRQFRKLKVLSSNNYKPNRTRVSGSVKARTENLKDISKHRLEQGKIDYPEKPGIDYHRPKTRGECKDGLRPCPYVSCKYHLYVDVMPNGNIKYNFPDIEVEDMKESCALDVADRGGATLEEVGVLINTTRERVRQLQDMICSAIVSNSEGEKLKDYVVHETRRKLPVYSDEIEESVESDDDDEEKS